MKRFLRPIRLAVAVAVGIGLLGALAAGTVYFYLTPSLPSVDSLRDVRYQVPLKVYSADGKLIAEFGEKKRVPLRYAQIPVRMVHAFIAAEDERFFQHPGVDYQGILRAVWYMVRTGEKGPGGSTITMQVARNFFLSPEKTFLRKVNEILLSLKIEHALSKEEILQLYLNKIYLGNRAYGVGAAAQIYYGTTVSGLDLAQTAMIAGLPKAPSRYNPIADPRRALLRRAYVLQRMLDLGYITKAQFDDASKEPVTARVHGRGVELYAPYLAEMVRADVVKRFGEDDAYTAGYTVYTTIDSRRQAAAVRALRGALLNYDRRHGYRGTLKHVALATFADVERRDHLLSEFPPVGGLRAALVVSIGDKGAVLYLEGGKTALLPWDGIKWARPFINRDARGAVPESTGDVISPGDVVRVQGSGNGMELAEVPQVEGALVSMSPRDGAIVALSGGFDFYKSKFNRATQAYRQPGSNFKPFIYSAALEHGFTAATLVNDAPIVVEDASLEGLWRPENYSGRFFGPTRLREALVHSRNLVSIRVLRRIGVPYAVDYVARFGFPPERMPKNLSLALGSAAVTPLEVVTGYAVFANGGYRVRPYYIRKIVNNDGEVLFKARSPSVCDECGQSAASATGASAAPRVISPQNAYIMTTMMRDVIRRGTGRGALVLERHDLAGKTGTTNDQQDAWFSGFNRDVVTTCWVGFDQVKPLGRIETGAHAALPMWIDYMREALKNVPERFLPEPSGLVTVRIDSRTGLAATADDPRAIFEVFRSGEAPRPPNQGASASGGAAVTHSNPLF